MSLVTPNYSIPYLTPGDRMAQIPDVDKAQALRIESLLETANVPPGNPDLNDVLVRLNQLEALTQESQGVMTITHSNFEIYTAPQDTPTLYRRGKVVNFLGALRCNMDGVLGTSNLTIGTIPAELRPPQRAAAVQQGSGTTKWFLQVMADGGVSASRPDGATGSNFWMPFNLVWTL
ncbi:hypothetical protein ACT3UD_11000 [Glutamicibacter sp. 287]|uniref:hypothetical protein n=1 Tax=Glutamicibacter sp. 287 TaxID=3457732 RepID=UPI0040336C72